MPIKYVGKSIDHVGKTVWEIVGNLKNFGIGRVIQKSSHERYPEPSYMRILKVQTCPNPEFETPDDVRKVRVWVEKVFRGRIDPQPIEIHHISYKADYILIPKEKEAEICKIENVPKLNRIFPKTGSFPPLLKELIIREKKAKGEVLTKEPEMTICYRQSSESFYRIADDGERPNVERSYNNDLSKTKAPRLYKNVKTVL